jgi:hypothetical protein
MIHASPLNVRPVTPPVFNLSGANGEATLQEVFNAITSGGPGIHAVNDQVPSALFARSDQPAVASFIVEIAGFAPLNRFGIYSSNDSTNRALIFGGSDSGGSQAMISFLASGQVFVNGSEVATGFGGSFGFYIHTPQGRTFFTEDSLNGGNPQALIYQGDNATEITLPGLAPLEFTDEAFIVAFEDLRFRSSDRDYNDLVVLVGPMKGATPVPEPHSAIVFGVGAVIVGAVVRRKRADRG